MFTHLLCGGAQKQMACLKKVETEGSEESQAVYSSRLCGMSFSRWIQAERRRLVSLFVIRIEMQKGSCQIILVSVL
jgi:hypothetical protein